MSRMISSTAFDDKLAKAIGHFIQASAVLEHAVQNAIVRMLPLTDNMGEAIFCDNSMSANLKILRRLLKLEEVPVSAEWKGRLLDLIPKIIDSSADRNTIAHHRLIAAKGEEYFALIHKNGERTAMPVVPETITGWAVEAEELAYLIGHMPHSEYDLSKWDTSFPSYSEEDWPARKK